MMKIHELEINYNQIDKLGVRNFYNCKYTAGRNSKSDCYEHLAWFLTKSEVAQCFYIEVTSVDVKPL